MNRHTLTLIGVKQHKLNDYVEQLCKSEKVKIKTCYEDSYSFLHTDRDSNWFTQQVRDESNVVIESNDYNRLKFVEHLYLKRVAVGQQLKQLDKEINGHSLTTSPYSGVRVEIQSIGAYPNQTVQKIIENWNSEIGEHLRLPDGVTFRSSFPAQLGDVRSPHLKATYIPKVPIESVTFTTTIGSGEYYKGPNGKIIELTKSNSDSWKKWVRDNYERVNPPPAKISIGTKLSNFIYDNYKTIQLVLMSMLTAVILLPVISCILTNILK